MLDSAKAYDSFERLFLMALLAGFGFTSRSTELAVALHNNTTALFQVNGVRCHPVAVARGIRQGCPLAPLLFLLGIETLGHAFKQRPEIVGLRFRIGGVKTEQLFAGLLTTQRCSSTRLKTRGRASTLSTGSSWHPGSLFNHGNVWVSGLTQPHQEPRTKASRS